VLALLFWGAWWRLNNAAAPHYYSGAHEGDLVVVAPGPSGGVWLLACDESTDPGAKTCAATQVAAAWPAGALDAVTSCAASSFAGGLVVALASPQGAFAVAVDADALLGQASSPLPQPLPTLARLNLKGMGAATSRQRPTRPGTPSHGQPHHQQKHQLEEQQEQQWQPEVGEPLPDGEGVDAVAVTSGWLSGHGLALAFATVDKLYYARCPGDPRAALRRATSSSSRSSNNGHSNGGAFDDDGNSDDVLVWRDEWVSVLVWRD
jgi:hypothetical protein